jgi:hypothetical protein
MADITNTDDIKFLGKRLIFVVDDVNIYTIPSDAMSLFGLLAEMPIEQGTELTTEALLKFEEGRVTKESAAKLAAYIIKGFKEAKEKKDVKDDDESKPA